MTTDAKPTQEQWAAQRLATILNRAAVDLLDVVEEYRRLAQQARAGNVHAAGYAYLAHKAHSALMNVLPNLGLPQAFESAALADQAHSEGPNR